MPSSPRPSLFCLHPLPDVVMARLRAGFTIEERPRDDDPSVEEISAAMRRHDGMITTVTDRLPAAVFAVGDRRVRLVANFGVGVNLIDLAAAKAAGVAVTNTPGALTDCTADLTIGLILMTMRRMGEGERLVRTERWHGWRPTHHLGRRVSGKTLGIVGMGRIGQAVAQRARFGFGMHILYTNRSAVDSGITGPLGAESRPLDRLLAEADIVSLHCPSTPETRGMLDARRLALMGTDAVLINTARGDLFDEAALVAALDAGRPSLAGLDVYREEPDVPNALRHRDDVVVLPHLGSATVETRTAMGMMVADNVEAFFAEREPPNRVA